LEGRIEDAAQCVGSLETWRERNYLFLGESDKEVLT